MKKVTLLFIVPLAMLMADFTLTDGKLIPTNEPVAEPTPPVAEPTPPVAEPTPPVAEPTPVAVGGIIPNSVDLVWEDSFGPNIGDPAWVSQGYPLFWARPLSFPINGSFPRVNAWHEFLEEGDGSSCSRSISTATNTVVEVGRIAAWIYYEDGNEWVKYVDAHTRVGAQMPTEGDPFAGLNPSNYLGCSAVAGAERQAHIGYSVNAGITPSGNGLYKPKYGWIFHGFGGSQHQIQFERNPKAVLVTMFARLVVENDQLPDDRANAKFVMHVGVDKKENTGATVQGGVGPSRWKKITNDWQPFNMLTGGWSKAEFMATNPPMINTP